VTNGPRNGSQGTYITANFLEVVRERPLLGRAFHELDPAELASAILISHSLWKQRYQETPEIIGREVRVNGDRKIIVGVMPEDFLFPIYAEVWTVLDPSERKGNFGEMSVTVVGRLDAMTPPLAQLNAELAEKSAQLLPEAEKEGYCTARRSASA
jgi:putative ABC transport system permease protein